MIENHFELNMALNGCHYGRIIFPRTLSKAEAQARAKRISTILQTGDAANWHFTLTSVECVGREVTF